MGALRFLNLNTNLIGSMANLRTLDLSWNKLGNAGTIAFADAIKPTAENPIGSLLKCTVIVVSGNPSRQL
jgi:hypothetical protein